MKVSFGLLKAFASIAILAILPMQLLLPFSRTVYTFLIVLNLIEQELSYE